MRNKKFLGGYFDDKIIEKVNDYCKKNNVSSTEFLGQAIDVFFNKEFSKTDYQTLIIDKLFILSYMNILSLSGDKNTEKYNDMAVKKLQEIKDDFLNSIK